MPSHPSRNRILRRLREREERARIYDNRRKEETERAKAEERATRDFGVLIGGVRVDESIVDSPRWTSSNPSRWWPLSAEEIKAKEDRRKAKSDKKEQDLKGLREMFDKVRELNKLEREVEAKKNGEIKVTTVEEPTKNPNRTINTKEEDGDLEIVLSVKIEGL
jgi:hypothetical protein